MKKSHVSHTSSKQGNENVHLASIGVAVPPFAVDQAQGDAFLEQHYAHKISSRSLSILHKVFAHPSIGLRFFAVESLDELINETPDERIDRFLKWAVELSAQAIEKALSEVGLTSDMISGLVVNTCTGYLCPGISTYLVEKLGLSRQIRAFDLVGSGCGGAIPNLQLGEGILKNDKNKVTVCVSVEICSAIYQMGNDLSLIISNAIFSDGAAASVLWNRSEGLKIVASTNRYAPEHREAIRLVYKNGQLHNQLSLNLPRLASQTAAMVLQDLLKPRGLSIQDIDHWAIHPGGEKVINAVKEKIGLSEAHVKMSREVLAKYGNMSSPTIYFILNEIMNNRMKPGDRCVLLTFGAGLSAHALLVRME